LDTHETSIELFMVRLDLLLAAASLVLSTTAVPSQVTLSAHGSGHINPLKRASPLCDPQIIPPLTSLSDLAAISPFYIPSQKPSPLPQQCSLTRVSLLIRHSSIKGNDDEYEQTMGPFINKIEGMTQDRFPSEGEWSWLRDWRSPIGEEGLEELSERGRGDAKVSGWARGRGGTAEWVEERDMQGGGRGVGRAGGQSQGIGYDGRDGGRGTVDFERLADTHLGSWTIYSVPVR